MGTKINLAMWAGIAASLFVPSSSLIAQNAALLAVQPAKMARVGQVDERFQSYNIEAVEVTGGRFWKPYGSSPAVAPTGSEHPPATPGGLDPSLFEYRAPIDLSNVRLRKLASALGPVYLRVSGTWMNSSWFQDSDAPAPSKPPAGFNSVLTRAEWKGVVDFARAVNARIVTSFAISAGTRDAEGVWTADQARELLSFTKSAGGSIAAAEFMNEPTFAEIGGAPHGYTANDYARDFAVFRKFVKSDAPGMTILGPGGVGEGSALAPSAMRTVSSADILTATGPAFDVISYHSYGAVSSRCGRLGAGASTSSDDALSAEWLGRGKQLEAYYAAIRDRFEPGKALWNTETAQAACGGDRWAAAFIDAFRYLDQLGSLARAGVQVQMHNTLDASDYGLLDEKTYEPRPDYWAALLWRRLMGSTVLDPGPTAAPNLHIYAQCLRGIPGGAALLAINADRTATQSLEIPKGAQRYTLTADDLLGMQVKLNGTSLMLGEGDALPEMRGVPVHAGVIAIAPVSITFLAFPDAHNAACR
jgi:hypothetical protein